MKKSTILLLALAMVICIGVGATLAYLFVNTDPVVNTFTYGDVNIDLNESDADKDSDSKKNNYQMIPGNEIAKDPVVTVKADSVESWLFVKIVETENVDDFLSYAIAEGWKLYDGTEAGSATINTVTNDTYVIFREVSKSNADQPFQILANNKVKVLDTVEKQDMEAIKADGNLPKITFTAHAVQKANLTLTVAYGIAFPANP